MTTDVPGTPGETPDPASVSHSGGGVDPAPTSELPSVSDAPTSVDGPAPDVPATPPDGAETGTTAAAPGAAPPRDTATAPDGAETSATAATSGDSELDITSVMPGITEAGVAAAIPGVVDAPSSGEPAGSPGSTGGGKPPSGGKHRRQRGNAEPTGTAAGTPKRRRWLKRTVIGLSILVVLALALGAGGWFYLNYRLGEIPKVHVKGLKPPPKPGGPFNMLLVGSDTRSFCTTAVCQSHLGNQGANGGQRSDVIILMRVVPATRSIYMLSIPRDTWVTLANSGGQGNRINAAFNNGPVQLVATIEQDFGIPINHYAYANFLGFSNAVSALGGVWMDFHYRVRDFETGLRIHKTGCQYLNGVESLQLVRSRDLQYFANGQWNYDGLGDLSRIRRQEEFFHAVIDKARSDYNPLSLNAFIASAVKDIEVDDTFSTGDLRNLAFEFHSMSSNNLHTEVIPTMGAVTPSGQDILLPVWRLDRAMIARFLRVGTTKSSKSVHVASPGTTTTTAPVTGTTTVPIIDNNKNYPEPWNPVPCNP